jgi:hypothetical protein
MLIANVWKVSVFLRMQEVGHLEYFDTLHDSYRSPCIGRGDKKEFTGVRACAPDI